TYVVRATEEKEAEKLRKDAKILEEAGCFGIVLEKIPSALAAEVTQSVKIPTIGIGAGSEVDGQVLVLHDMLGINQEFSPRFLRRYHNLHDEMIKAFIAYLTDVKSGEFPSEREQY
ncbi:MAG TPA: 3-methyl-2-oxobutanoate hydroxymethyltransferase, partial [Bacteroidales bacterium]